MKEFKQTWWDDNLEKRMDEFQSWIGSAESQSKVEVREFVKHGCYKSLVDIGCGTATEFFAYQKEYPELKYLGIDSCKLLNKMNTERGVPMLECSCEKIDLPDKSYQIAFSRHVLEHQPNFEETLNEMIRVSSMLAIHVFFIPPSENGETISYDPNQNLYHNQYNKGKIEAFLNKHERADSFFWKQVNASEWLLIIDTQ